MPGVRRVHIRFNRVADVRSEMTEEEEEQMEEDEETITKWLRGNGVGKVEVTVEDEPNE
jgi:L-fucose isomerase-like protein